MTDDNLTIGELGGYTNNSMNREGLKKLVEKVNAGVEAQGYTKAETDALLADKADVDDVYTKLETENLVYENTEWEFCENSMLAVKEENADKYEYLFVLVPGSSSGDRRTQYIKFRSCDENPGSSQWIAFSFDKVGQAIQMYKLSTSASYPDRISVNTTEYSFDDTAPIDLASTDKIIDAYTGTTIDATNISQYVDATTNVVLKDFRIIKIYDTYAPLVINFFKDCKYAELNFEHNGYLSVGKMEASRVPTLISNGSIRIVPKALGKFKTSNVTTYNNPSSSQTLGRVYRRLIKLEEVTEPETP